MEIGEPRDNATATEHFIDAPVTNSETPSREGVVFEQSRSCSRWTAADRVMTIGLSLRLLSISVTSALQGLGVTPDRQNGDRTGLRGKASRDFNTPWCRSHQANTKCWPSHRLRARALSIVSIFVIVLSESTP
jgi:hypothetical protein